MAYTAPVRDIAHTLKTIAGLPELIERGLCEDLDLEVVDAILEEAGKFASEQLAPLNRTGDTEGALEAWQQAITSLSDPEQQQLMRQRLFRLQTAGWGLLVADPDELYDRDYGSTLERIRSKVEAVEQSEAPPLTPIFEELAEPAVQ